MQHASLALVFQGRDKTLQRIRASVQIGSWRHISGVSCNSEDKEKLLVLGTEYRLKNGWSINRNLAG